MNFEYELSNNTIGNWEYMNPFLDPPPNSEIFQTEKIWSR